jgi:hypothetical protein
VYPDTTILLLEAIPIVGYYKDFILILEMISDSISQFGNLKRLLNAMIDLYAVQLSKDKLALEESDHLGNDTVPILSLAGKYAPREGKKYAKFRKELVKKLFGESRTPDKDYRHLLAKLTKSLDIPEVKMCAKIYSEIDFKRVPSLCMNRYRKAFLNELVNKKGQRLVPLSESEEETGNRHPYVEDRVKCRKNLQEALAKGNVCGKVLQPHEIVSQLMRLHSLSAVESSLYDGQWQKIKEGVLEGIEKLNSLPKSSGINLGKLVPLVDVSGSMSGTPMEVAIALGILVSELSDPAFRDHFITFETDPSWVSLKGINSLFEKVKTTMSASWGGSTNFKAALELILRTAKEHKLSPEEIPDLIVFSDMQFDTAGKYGETMHKVIKRRFAEVGMEICGQPYRTPKIIYWNLRGNTYGYPVQSNTPNTQMLSGFSPSLLKLLLDGEEMVIEEVASNGKVTQREVTPEETLRKALDDPRYDCIRVILSRSNEGVLSKYYFTPPIPMECETSEDAV